MTKRVVSKGESLALACYMLLFGAVLIYYFVEWAELWATWGPSMLAIPAAMSAVAVRFVDRVTKRP